VLIGSCHAAGRHPGDPTRMLSHEEVSANSKLTTGTIIACLRGLLKDDAVPTRTQAPYPIEDAAVPSPASKRHRK